MKEVICDRCGRKMPINKCKSQIRRGRTYYVCKDIVDCAEHYLKRDSMKINVKGIIKKEGILKIFGHCGLICVLMRPHLIKSSDYNLFHWCGYVVIPIESKVAQWAIDKGEEFFEKSIDVHGGVTYFEVNDNLLWIGFDCAHLDDICMVDSSLHSQTATYKDLKFVTAEVKKMAEQVLKLYAIDHL